MVLPTTTTVAAINVLRSRWCENSDAQTKILHSLGSRYLVEIAVEDSIEALLERSGSKLAVHTRLAAIKIHRSQSANMDTITRTFTCCGQSARAISNHVLA